MGWVESGRAWGERAADWAYLVEPYARRANDALFDRAGSARGHGCSTSPAAPGTQRASRPAGGPRSPGWMPPRR